MDHLRPVERRVLQMQEQGLTPDEIARRVKKSPESIDRMIAWTAIPRSRPPERRSPSAIGRRVLALRAAGESHERVAQRFHRGANYIRQVEALAHYQLGLEKLRERRTWPAEGGS